MSRGQVVFAIRNAPNSIGYGRVEIVRSEDEKLRFGGLDGKSGAG